MNATGNFTDIIGLSESLEEENVSLVESMELDGGDEHIGFSLENSLLKIIPKFFKALATLLISGLLLGMTFLLISLWKRGCRTHRKLEEDGKTPSKEGHPVPLQSVIVTPPEDEDRGVHSSSSTGPSSSSLQPVRPKYMKVPKQALLRRASGPFGSDVLSFVGEQYTMKNVEREGHHHPNQQGPHGHGGRSSPRQFSHFHGGVSSTGSTQQQQDEGESTSKWNCFKGNKT